MPLSSQQLAQIAGLNPARRFDRSKLKAFRQLSGTGSASAPVRALIDRLLETAPADHAAPAETRQVRKSPNIRDLGASMLAWIDRLPRDPAQLSADDVQTLTNLHRHTSRGSGDELLLESILGPLRAASLKADAERGLAAVRDVGLVEIPPELQPLVAAAIRAETPTTSADDAVAMAGRSISQAHAMAVSAHAERVATAEKTLADSGVPA